MFLDAAADFDQGRMGYVIRGGVLTVTTMTCAILELKAWAKTL